jgi:hypothetical protein
MAKYIIETATGERLEVIGMRKTAEAKVYLVIISNTFLT